ncbi:MAG: ATP-binding protein [Myxococcota bacterium]
MKLRVQARFALVSVIASLGGALLFEFQVQRLFAKGIVEEQLFGLDIQVLADELSSLPRGERETRLTALASYVRVPMVLRSDTGNQPLSEEYNDMLLVSPVGVDQKLVIGPMLRPRLGFGALLGLVLSLLFIAAIAIVAAGRPISRRLRRLQSAVVELRDGDFELDFGQGAADEVADLERVVSEAARKLGARFQERSELIQAVAHEMNTPLSRLQFLIERIDDGELRDRVGAELSELGKLSDELASWVEADAAPVRRADVALASVLEDLVELEMDRTEGRVPIRLTTIRVTVLADRRQIERAIENVLRNAVAFAKTQVHARAESVSGWAVITIEDDGPGIPDADRERVFQPFVSLRDARDTDKSGGMGLGLAVASRVLSRHGGGISIDRGDLGGARVSLRLPAAGASRPVATD